MTALSEKLNASLPEGWVVADVATAISDKWPIGGSAINRATIYKYFSGNHAVNPQDRVLVALASVLPGVSVTDLREAANVPRGETEPWVPPDEAGRLSHRQRAALAELIKSMTAPIERAAEKSPHLSLAASQGVVQPSATVGDQASAGEENQDSSDDEPR